MTQTAFFEGIGAPLANPRWSWGAERADGSLVLRVWKKLIRTIDGKKCVLLLDNASHSAKARDLGRRERMRHVERIRGGASFWLVVVEDRPERPWSIWRANEQEVYPGGALLQRDGDLWVELRSPVPAEDLVSRGATGA